VDPRLCIEGSFAGALDKGTLDAILSAAAAGEGEEGEGGSEKALEDARRIFQGVRTTQMYMYICIFRYICIHMLTVRRRWMTHGGFFRGYVQGPLNLP
jgi:hypothetical protein